MHALCKTLKRIAFLYFLAISYTLLTQSTGILLPDVAMAAQSKLDPVDMVFVIDNSGSMKKNDPDSITPKVVSTFVQKLTAGTQVAVVLFDQKARLLIPLTQISDPKGKKRIIDSMKKIDYKGQFTNTPVGIERALYELKTNGRQKAHKSIIFITDGIVDTGNKEKDKELTQWLKQDIAEQCKRTNTRIFGIALTEAADYSLIQSLASSTDGEYFRTFSADKISKVLDQIKLLLAPPKSKQKEKLAPLELLPIPEKKPQAKTIEPSPSEKAPTEKTPPLVTPPPPVKEPAIAKKIWTTPILLALIMTAMFIIVIFLIRNNRRKKEAEFAQQKPAAEKKLTIPEAYLENVEQTMDMEKLPYKIEKEITNIGRSKRNDFVIDDLAISGFHATVEFRHMYFYLEDQLSTNGTKLNDRPLEGNEQVRLKSGDCITFANFKYNFTITNQIPFGDTVMLSMTALADPEAEATVVLDLEGMNSKQGLLSCIQNHLVQIYGLSDRHKDYVSTYFSADQLDIIATNGHKNLSKTIADNTQHCTSVIENKAFYVICSLPAPIDTAAQWYGEKYNGFTQFIFQWIRSEEYVSGQCEQLCIVTFGQNPSTWVSITIVPTHAESNPIEIMSVDFLNEEEKSSLGLDFDNHGRVI